MRCWFLACLLLGFGLLAGCGSSGPKKYTASGKITFDKQPIPSGTIYFTPDTAKKNMGPQGKAEIKNGEYRTDDKFGFGAGPTVVEVIGMNGDRIICQHKFNVDMPDEDTTKDFDVPKSAAVDIKVTPADLPPGETPPEEKKKPEGKKTQPSPMTPPPSNP